MERSSERGALEAEWQSSDTQIATFGTWSGLCTSRGDTSQPVWLYSRCYRTSTFPTNQRNRQRPDAAARREWRCRCRRPRLIRYSLLGTRYHFPPAFHTPTSLLVPPIGYARGPEVLPSGAPRGTSSLLLQPVLQKSLTSPLFPRPSPSIVALTGPHWPGLPGPPHEEKGVETSASSNVPASSKNAKDGGYKSNCMATWVSKYISSAPVRVFALRRPPASYKLLSHRLCSPLCHYQCDKINPFRFR